MKKNYLFGAMAAGMLLFTACSNDEDVINGGGNIDDAAQVLTLNIASSGDGLTTRAGRPLYSNEAGQQISNVTLYFVNEDDKIVLTKRVNWASAQTYADGKQLEIALKKENNQKLANGKYTVYAVGSSASSDYTFAPAIPTSDGVVAADPTTAWSDFSATITYDIAKQGAEEVFAGSLTQLEVVDGAFALTTNGGKNAITLHRQVAGVTGYLTNIPVGVDGKNSRYLRLVAVGNNTKVNFVDFNTSFTQSPAADAWYIVNGKEPATADAKFADGTTEAHTLYKIDLAEWFTSVAVGNEDYKGNDYNKDGFLGHKDVKDYLDANVGATDYSAVWTNKNDNANQSLVRGSVFDGKFVIPFEKTANGTLQLQLLDKDDSVLKYWNVNVKKDDLHTTVAAGAPSTEKADMDVSKYNIFRNHMYNVGLKEATNPGTTDPEEPTNPEKPEDLSKGQDLIIQVNDNWELIHGMDLD